jgi:hypothetical protein
VVLMVVAGGARVQWDGGEIEAKVGATVLVPAAAVGALRFAGVEEGTRALVVRCGTGGEPDSHTARQGEASRQ